MRLLTALLLGVLLGLALGARPAAAAGPPLVRWAYYVGYDSASLVSLRAYGAQLDYVSPQYFAMDGSGRLLGGDDPTVSPLVRQLGAKLVPMVQNRALDEDFSPVLNDATIRQRAIAGLVDAVVRYNYDGIHIDFETLLASDRPALSRFMAELKAALAPKGKLVTMAVAAKAKEVTTGWSGPYDYAALGKHADLLVVMTYGFRTNRSTVPGSTAPVEWVDNCAAFAASQIPPEKLLLGIALWGYDWDTTSGGSARARSHAEITELQTRFKGTFGYDELSQSAWLKYSNAGAQHVVWYEDGRSIGAKIGVAVKHDLAGFGGWRLGHEGPEAWQVISGFSRELAALDWPVADGYFFTQANGYPLGTRRKGFAVTNEGGLRFWDEYQRLGGAAVVGYPVSGRFRWESFVVQVMQKAVFQWRPEAKQVYFVNVFDELHRANKDNWLFLVRSTPKPLEPSFDGKKSWTQTVADRLALLDAFPAVKERYLAAPDPMMHFGLPTSRVQDMGNHFAVRLQRAVLQQWKVDVPWARAGEVTVANGGDVGKEAGLFPLAAMQPEVPPLQ